jgi:hypothetical protein
MASKAFAWLATGGGAWALASNWDDLTDGQDPSQIAPGPGDTVTINGPAGTQIETITGPGSAASATLTGDTALSGQFAIGTVLLGANAAGGLLAIDPSSELTTSVIDIASGSVLDSGLAANIAASSSMTLGAGQSGIGAATCSVDATEGAAIQVAALTLDASSAAIYVDPSASFEVGEQGGPALGALTIDAGTTLSGFGDANAYGTVVNNGTIIATGGTLLTGTLSGGGQLEVDANSELTLNAATGSGQSITFNGNDAVLALAAEYCTPQGTLSGFVPGDAIDELGSPISAATWTQTNASQGVLTVYYGGQIAGTFTLAGNYTSDVFLTAPDGAGGTLITVAPQTKGGGNPSGGTQTPDDYLWVGTTSGNWNSASNWKDVTTGQDPAKVAPGKNNIVTINGPTNGQFLVVAGPANAAALACTGDTALTGSFALGTFTLGVGDAQPGSSILDLLPGSVVAAATVLVADGELSLSGDTDLAVAGTITLGGGPPGLGLPVTMLSATEGATITTLGLSMGGGSGDSLITDPTSIIQIGSGSGATTGAVTVEPNTTVAANGDINPFGAIVDQGTITASGGALILGSVTGSGALSIGTDSELVIEASNAMPITFADDTGELAVANELVSLGGTLTNFVPGDAIDILEDPITSIATGKGAGTTVILTLYYNSTVVCRFTLAATQTNQKFFLAPDGYGGTLVLSDISGNGGGGGGGQGDTDTLEWTKDASGNWNTTGNWFDLTTNSASLAPPGTENPVIVLGPTGASYQTIAGPGVAATASFFGNTILSGAYTFGTLSIGGLLNGDATAGLVDFATGAALTASAASLDGGTLLVAGTSSLFSLGGTLSVGGSNNGTLLVSNHGTAILNGLSLQGQGASTIGTDPSSVIEIGQAGNAVAGAVTIDPGISVSGFGTIALGGNLVENGTLRALGGTLTVGNTSGSGTLVIGTEATLALTAQETAPILFGAGDGGTLLLQGTEESPAATIDGFAPGESIVTGSSQVNSVTYTAGSGGLGTLTLYYDGQIAGELVLAGNYSGDNFTVQPDGDGSLIGVQANTGTISPGTPTPDLYAWTGAADDTWINANNWQDLTTGQNPAAIAPGQNNIVTISGGANDFTTIIGPADAATLTLLDQVALAGAFAIGQLDIGSSQQAGTLAIGTGTSIQTANTAIQGGLLVQGGALQAGGTLTLQSGALAASDGAAIELGGLALAGEGSAFSVSASSTLEIGATGNAEAGVVTIDSGYTLAGTGAANPQGGTVDNGTVTASGGTLLIGTVTGTGVMDIGPGADLALDAEAAASLTIDFAGPGTLTALTATPQAWIAGFGSGDEIILPVSGVTDTEYVQTGANTGVLTLLDGPQTVASLTLLGIGQDQIFSVTGGDGGTVLTTQPEPWGGGGNTMRGGQDTSGSGAYGVVQDFGFWASLPQAVQQVLANFQQQAGNESYIWTSPDGTYFGPAQPGVANFAVVSSPAANTRTVLPSGYEALLAEGNASVILTDADRGNALIYGNQGNDSIFGIGANDTLAGAPNANTWFWTDAAATILGGGNDTIYTGQGPCSVSTAAGYRSLVVLGPSSDNVVYLNGYYDTLGASGVNFPSDTVTAAHGATIFAPVTGELVFHGGNAADIIGGQGGVIEMYGGTGNGSILWCGASSDVVYYGGAGTATIVGGSGLLDVNGGSAPITVYGGTGNINLITGAPGASEFAVGYGDTTVNAATGNIVWLVASANNQLIADPSSGNIIFWGANSSGNNIFQAPTGAGCGDTTMRGGSGNSTLVGGSGTTTMIGGSGANLFEFTNGLGGGTDIITDFSTTQDEIQLNGYSGYTNYVDNGSEILVLADGTHIQLDGITSLTGVNIHMN